MSKTSEIKVQKSATRPSDVSEWREYSSPADAIDEAVRGAHDRPDEAELNAEVAEILRDNPGLSRFAAYQRAASGSGATVTKSAVRAAEDSVGQLGEALTRVHTEARRANLNAGQRHTLAKASREAELTYLRETRPWAVGHDIEKADADGDALVAKAERIKKSDSTLSRFDAMREAAHGRRA